MLTGRDFEPTVVPGGTVAVKVNVLAGPSRNSWVEEPPIDERFARTVSPVLVGFVPGVTWTDRVVVPPANTVPGSAEPTPVGGVGVGTLEPVMEMSSMPTHSSLPTASVVITRIWTRG